MTIARRLASASMKWTASGLPKRTPASWLLGAPNRRRRGRYPGILVPSFAAHAIAKDANLVLWKRGPDPPLKVTVHDPSGRLPKSQLSWD